MEITKALPSKFLKKIESWSDSDKNSNYYLLELDIFISRFNEQSWSWLGHIAENNGLSLYVEHIRYSSYVELLCILFNLEIIPTYKVFVYDDIFGNYEVISLNMEGGIPIKAPSKFSSVPDWIRN
ncbi:hypothetical protein ACE193_19030 [Bernardetia sp. OM2101]|uniref:hypothetical protein n=1 Tax=Bernardetia sp. OM2101 TaxID=3344876 RepID=UPI0035CEC320